MLFRAHFRIKKRFLFFKWNVLESDILITVSKGEDPEEKALTYIKKNYSKGDIALRLEEIH